MKGIVNKYLIAAAILPSLILSAAAQTDIQTQFNNVNERALQEKIFVHTDKDFYLTGETLQFTIYLVDAIVHKPLDLSKVAYIEILDKKRNPIAQAKVSMQSGKGFGSIVIPDAGSAEYTLRAYTRWMKNFSGDFFFEKQISILSTQQGPPAKQSAHHSDSLQITFFPEGGNLVNDLTSKVGFQATNSRGEGIDMSGSIIDETGSTVTSFKTLRFGIGSFVFTPKSGHAYSARIERHGKSSLYNLPVAYSRGYVMSLNNLSDEKMHLIVSQKTTTLSNDTILLFVHTRHDVKIVTATVLRDGKAGFIIDKNKLGDGISHLTVMSNRHQPLCERLYFKKPVNKLLIQSTTDKSSYLTRQKVSLGIASTDINSNAIPSSMSLSVYKVDSLQSADVTRILGYLLLTSDLKGNVESPDYYLEENDETAKAATDNLMLTHGWTRFNWENVLKQQSPVISFAPEYEGPVISGKIVDRKTQTPVSNVPVYLSIPGSGSQLFTARSMLDGAFEFYVRKMVRNNEMVIQAEGDPESFKITIDNPFSEKLSEKRIPDVPLHTYKTYSAAIASVHSQSEGYFRKEKPTRPMLKDSLPFYGDPDKRYLLDDYEHFPTIEDVFREYTPEVMVMKRDGEKRFYVLNKKEQDFFTTKPLVLLDGLPLLNNDQIISMSTRNIKSLEVVTRKYWFGPLMFSGIINFTTFKSDLAGIDLDPETFVLDFEVLDQQKEFYTPHYETSEQVKSRIPDFRTVLHWVPDLATDKDGKHQLDFYTSDEQGKFIGVIHGISNDGLAGTGVFTFQVDK